MIDVNSNEDFTTIINELPGGEGVEFVYVPHGSDPEQILTSCAMRIYADGRQCLRVTNEGVTVESWQPDEMNNPKHNALVIKQAREK